MKVERGLISFVVVNFNGRECLGECLSSIAAQRDARTEVLVVDNGSTDGSWDQPYWSEPGWRLLRLRRNHGFAGANNMAFRFVSGEYIALVNNDVVLKPDWSQNMRAAIRNRPQVGSVASRVVQSRHPELIDSAGMDFCSCGTVVSWRGWRVDRIDPARHHPLGAVASAALYSRSAIDEAGGFRRRYFCYYEDTDLAIRLFLCGFSAAYAHDAVAHHRGSFSGRKSRSFYTYHLRRNVEYVYWTNMLGSLAWRNLPAHLAYEFAACVWAAAGGDWRAVWKAKAHCFTHWRRIRSDRHRLAESLGAGTGAHPVAHRLRKRLASSARVMSRLYRPS